MCSAHALSLAACHTSLVREICDTFFQRRLGIVPPSAIVAPSSVCAECIRHHHKYYSPSTLNTFLISAPYKLFYTVTEYTLLRSLPHAFPHRHCVHPKRYTSVNKINFVYTIIQLWSTSLSSLVVCVFLQYTTYTDYIVVALCGILHFVTFTRSPARLVQMAPCR